MKQYLSIVLALNLIGIQAACIDQEKVKAVTHQLTDKHSVYEQRQKMVQIALITGAVAVTAWAGYSWYTQAPRGTNAEYVKLLQSAISESKLQEYLEKARAQSAGSSWWGNKASDLGTFIGQQTVAGFVAAAVGKLFQAGSSVVNPQVMRIVSGSWWLGDVYRNVSDADKLVSVSVPLDLDFFMKQLDIIDYAVENSNDALLQEGGHGIVGYIDYVHGRMDADPEVPTLMKQELLRVRGTVVKKLDELYTLMVAEEKEQPIIWTAHTELCIAVKKLRVFELFRI